MPLIRVSFVTVLRLTIIVGSSSVKRLNALEILSSSPFFLAEIARVYIGNGNAIGANSTGVFLSLKVSPVAVNCNFEVTPISPAVISVMGI